MFNKLNKINLVFKQNLLQIKRYMELKNYILNNDESSLYVVSDNDITALLTFDSDVYKVVIDLNSLMDTFYITKEDLSGQIIVDDNIRIDCMKNFIYEKI